MGPENLSALLTNEFVRSSVWGVMLNLVLAALLACWMGRVYVKCGRSLSNRKAFSQNFILLTMTTSLVITLVQSNLALSLGMIGALSIVRFRSAIKEPEELTFLFLCIAVGLGLGASQRVMTVGALSIVLGVIWIANFGRRSQSQNDENLFLTVTTNTPDQLPLDHINRVLDEHCSMYRMKRIDRRDMEAESSYLLRLENGDSVQAIESSLREADQTVAVTFLDPGGTVRAA
jgi:Domain of unknown function (DUF4956)